MDNLKERLSTLKNQISNNDNQLCNYKSHLELIKEREVHYLDEIEVLLSNKEKPEVNKLHGRIKQLQEEKDQLHKQIDSDVLIHNQQLDRLQNELKMCAADVTATNEKLFAITTNIHLEENLLLEKDLELCSSEVYEKELHLTLLEEKNSRLLETQNSLRSELEDVKKSVECRESQLVEAYELINNLQETNFVNRTDLESLKGEVVKSGSDENSLFAEVNDKRLTFKETLVSLGEKCNKIKLEVSCKQRQILTRRLLNEELTNIIKHVPDECREDYEILIGTYRSRLLTLDNLSESYKQLLLEKEELLQKGLPNNISKFLDEVYDKSRKVEEGLSASFGMEFRAQRMMSIKLKTIERIIQEWKNTINQLQLKILEYEDTIQGLKLEASNALSEIKDHNICKNNENFEEVVEKGNNEEKSKEENKSGKSYKENIPENERENKPIQKKVMFTEETKSASNHIVRKGRKVLQCKPIHISDLINKK